MTNKWGRSTIVSNIREYCALTPIARFCSYKKKNNLRIQMDKKKHDKDY